MRLLSEVEKKNKVLLLMETKLISAISVHDGSRLKLFLSVVGNFFLVLLVGSDIFCPMSLVG